MLTHPFRYLAALLLAVCAVALAFEVHSHAQPATRTPEHARQYRRLLIRNAMIIYGNAKPPYGPMDLVLQDGVIADIRQSDSRAVDADAVIDATGKYVMPGIVNTHMHWHEAHASGIPQPIQYERNLYGDRLGKVRQGWMADLLVVNGNPLENLRLLNPYGTDVMKVNGRVVSNYTPVSPSDKVESVLGGGIEWTIKDGIPYHVPTLMREVKDMVARDRGTRGRQTTAGQ